MISHKFHHVEKNPEIWAALRGYFIPKPQTFFVGEWRPAKNYFFLNMWGIMRSVCGVDMRANGDVIVALGLLKENITSGVVIIKNKTN